MGTKVLETAERTTRCNTERQMTEKGFNIAVEAKKAGSVLSKPFGITGETDMEPLISVIVPIYNVKAYLDRCVESSAGPEL